MAAPPPPNPPGSHFAIPAGTSPTAEGTLLQTPLLHLYVYLLDKTLTGTLVLTAPSGQRCGLYIRDGAPERAVRQEGALATERPQIESATVNFCELPPESRYAFYQDQDFLPPSNKPAPRIEPLAVIMAAARQALGTTHAETTLRKVYPVPAGIAAGATPERFRLSTEERALVERLRKHRSTMADLVKTTGVPERIVRGVVYGMTITRHLDFGVSARPPVGIDRPPASMSTIPADQGQWNPSTGTTGLQYIEQTGPQPPQPSSDRTQVPAARSSDTQNVAHEKRRVEIEAKLAAAPSEDHFQILGLPRDATTADVKNAYFALAKSFHPDKLPKELADLRPRVQQLFALINGAFEELSDEGRRAEYLAAIAGPTTRRGKPSVDEQEVVARALDAAAAFQRAEFLQKTDLVSAEVYARRATEADPGEPSYMTLLAWIQAQQRPIPPTLEDGKTSPIYDDLLAQLDAVIKKEPSYERALFYRAVLLKRSGRMEMAIKDFTRAASLNPKNIDAAREVRLYEMRKGKKPGPATDKGSAPGGADPGGGLFNKFFKR